MTTLIKNGCIVNENRCIEGSLLIEGDRISRIFTNGEIPCDNYDNSIDATGCFVLPGIIDTHVHFREPGLTQKADIENESRAAAYGGVTSVFDMPNTIPNTTTPEALHDKLQLFAEKCHVNYACLYGATNDNVGDFANLDRTEVPAIKLFMGASTGNMLVDKYGSLLKIFAEAARCDMPIVAHCEDSVTIDAAMQQIKKMYGDDPNVAFHPLIRNEEACYESSALAVLLAKTYGTRLHVAHISTAKELELFGNNNIITAEAALPHLLFSSEDYAILGTKIKCNPAVKRAEDRNELRKALYDGRITTVATDHAPHLASDKQGGCMRAASGIPMLQFSLISMLSLAEEGILGIERIAELMCHAPARLFGIHSRGYIRKGYKADLAIIRRTEPWTLTADDIQSKCKWSPLEGRKFNWQVVRTICNGQTIYHDGEFEENSRGEKLIFR